jgi:hypothetical protein
MGQYTLCRYAVAKYLMLELCDASRHAPTAIGSRVGGCRMTRVELRAGYR